MKRIMALIIAFGLLSSLASCTSFSTISTLSYNDDTTELYYNGHTYINYNNNNGKYRIDPEEDADDWIEIATSPYGIFGILGANTVYYGNNSENPDFITNSRTIDFYIRNNLTFDNNTVLSLCDLEVPYSFKISEVTTKNTIKYTVVQKEAFTGLCDFFVAFEQFPYVKLWIHIYEYGDKLYLQDVWNSDYYEITNAFKEDIYRLGLNSYSYH